MTEGTPQTPPPEGTGDPAAPAPGSQQFTSVEEAEAFYRARQSGIDKAHNAQVAAMQADFEAQMNALRKPAAGAPSPQEGESAEAVRIRELEQQVSAERNARLLSERKSQYPYAASLFGDEIANLSPGALAAAEATGGSGGPIIDPNSAPRQPAGMPAVKPDEDKTYDESLADLRALAPAYQQMLRDKQ